MSETTDLAVIPRETALTVLTDPKQFDAFYEKVAAEVKAHVPDLTTERGRKEIASVAFKVVKTKTAIDKAGQLLTEEWRTQTKKVDEARKAIRDKLDELRDEVRQPLTDWEAAEEVRGERVNAALAELRDAAIIRADETSDDLNIRLGHIYGTDLPADLFQEQLPIASALRNSAITALTEGHQRALVTEQDARDLAKLREQEAERAAQETARLEKERAEQERLAAEMAEQERAKREQEAREKALAEAAEQSRLEAERRAKEALEAAEKAHQAELAAVEAERKKLADEQAERERIAAETKKADDARAKDRKHKAEVMGAAKVAIMEAAKVDEALAITIVRAIVAGEIPAVTLAF